MSESERRQDPAEPSTWLLLLATFSFVLPWIGLGLGVWGALQVHGGERAGWLLVVAGVAAIVLDILIDCVWAAPLFTRTAEPHLNRPAGELVGRTATVEEELVAGRGKVRVGDTVWLAEGPDLPEGTSVRIAAHRDVVLVVTSVDGAEGAARHPR